MSNRIFTSRDFHQPKLGGFARLWLAKCSTAFYFLRRHVENFRDLIDRHSGLKIFEYRLNRHPRSPENPRAANLAQGMLSTAGALRPILRTVEYGRNFYRVFGDLIDDDVGQGREHQFSPPGYSAAGAAKVGKILQPGASVIDRSRNSSGRFRVVAFYPFADTLQIFGGWQRPTDFQGCKNR